MKMKYRSRAKLVIVNGSNLLKFNVMVFLHILTETGFFMRWKKTPFRIHINPIFFCILLKVCIGRVPLYFNVVQAPDKNPKRFDLTSKFSRMRLEMDLFIVHYSMSLSIFKQIQWYQPKNWFNLRQGQCWMISIQEKWQWSACQAGLLWWQVWGSGINLTANVLFLRPSQPKYWLFFAKT